MRNTFLLLGACVMLSQGSEVVLAPECDRVLRDGLSQLEAYRHHAQAVEPGDMVSVRDFWISEIDDEARGAVVKLGNVCFGDDLTVASAHVTMLANSIKALSLGKPVRVHSSVP